MSILSKDYQIVVTRGQVGYPAYAGHPGYYTTIVQSYRTQVTKDVDASSVNQHPQNWIIASYELSCMVVAGVSWAEKPKCTLLALIANKVYHTSMLYKDIGYGCIIAERPGTRRNFGICKATGALPPQEANPLFAPSFNFFDYYDCTVVNGAEKVTKK